MALQRYTVDLQNRQKLPCTRRIWTQLEERCLIEAFKDIILQGWKADNGFKHGFLQQLLNKLRISLPGTDLTTTNINSKYGTWKKNYKDVFDILKNSGFNWSSSTCKVTADENAWNDYVAAHHGFAYIRNKSFPHYDSWADIFGSDTANGSYGFDGYAPPPSKDSQAHPPIYEDLDESNDMNHNNPSPEAGFQGDSGSPAGANANNTEGPREANPPTVEARKRKRNETVEELSEVIKRMWEKVSESIDKVAMRLGRDMDEAENRRKLVEVINNLPLVITRDERLKLTYALSKDEKGLDIFHVLPVDDKLAVVQMLLDGLVI